MEEDILKYFTGQGEQETEDIKPQYINNDSFETNINIVGVTINVDNEYYVKAGGYYNSENDKYSSIEVYNFNSLDNKEPLYSFDNLEIGNNFFLIRNLKRDKDGRFYGSGYTIDSEDQMLNYLVLFNNFIQDGELTIRKVYSTTTMGMPNFLFNDIAKAENSAEYFFLYTDNKKIYSYKIDITSGNTLKVFNFEYDTNSFIYSATGISIIRKITNIGDKIFFLMYLADRSQAAIPFTEEFHKLVIDENTSEENTIYTKIIKTQDINELGSQTVACFIEDMLFKNMLLIENGNRWDLYLQVIDIDGNEKRIKCDDENISPYNSDDYNLYGNFLVIHKSNQDKNFYFFDYIDNSNMIKFYNYNSSTQDYVRLVVLRKYNLNYLIGISLSNGIQRISFLKCVYSIGYSSIPYNNINFLIPQYLNLYSKANDLTSIIYSRDTINRFVAGNQLTATFNIPNYLLNNETIHREIVNGQTNLSIEDNNKPYSKNRFESLYMIYMYNIYIKDNTNEDNLINYEGSNRIADSLWNSLDYEYSPCLKARITYDDETTNIIELNTPTIENNIATYIYQVSGDIIKIEYLSNDEETVYATYRCNLTGENTITQTIEVEEG